MRKRTNESDDKYLQRVTITVICKKVWMLCTKTDFKLSQISTRKGGSVSLNTQKRQTNSLQYVGKLSSNAAQLGII